MNTTQLECFIAVAEMLNFAKAAEMVHMSQPAVTKRVQSLEEELDIALFERDTRHVVLTFAGKQFYAHAKSILLQEQTAMAGIAQLKAMQHQSLVIGCHNTEVYGYLGAVFAAVYQETRNLKPDIIEAPFHSLDMSLAAQTVDAVVGTYEMMGAVGISSAAFKAMASSPIYFVTRKDRVRNAPGSLRISDFTPERIRKLTGVEQRISCRDMEQYFASNPGWQGMENAYAKHTHVCDNMNAAFSVVEAGLGFMLVPEPDFLMREKFDYIRVSDAAQLHYGYFYNPKNDNPLLSVFRRKLEEYFEGINR